MTERVQIGDATLYCGDCREVLQEVVGIDAVISDPPYGIAHASHGQIFKEAASIAGDESLEVALAVREWARASGVACCMFFSPYRPMDGWRSVLTWAKGAHVGGGGDMATCWKRDFELIGVEGNRPLQGRRDSSVLHFMALSPPPSGHFAEKPVSLMEYLIHKLGADSVFDPFMGSGTTGVACVNLRKRFVGAEVERRWFDVACERIEAAYSQGRLFA